MQRNTYARTALAAPCESVSWAIKSACHAARGWIGRGSTMAAWLLSDGAVDFLPLLGLRSDANFEAMDFFFTLLS